MDRVVLANWEDVASAMHAALGAPTLVEVRWLEPERELLFHPGYDSSLGSVSVTRTTPKGVEIIETLFPEDVGDDVGREMYRRTGELLGIPDALDEHLVLRGIVARGDEVEDGILRGEKVALLLESSSAADSADR